jgi:tetratricopeptide (TPR) repeat protein
MNWGRNSFFVFALMFLFTSTYASKDLAGDTFLKNGDYKKAIEAYESVVQEGYIGHELFFNLGTAYSKIGNVSQSILNFEKALRLSPLDKATKEQLMQLNIKLQDKPSIYEDTGLLAFIKKVQFALSIDAWAFLSVFWKHRVLLIGAGNSVRLIFNFVKGLWVYISKEKTGKSLA